MWAIRILTGNQAGQIHPLKHGTNILGRATTCGIKILSPNVSKEHLQIDVLPDKVIVTDLKSRNGTFVNGVQIKSTKIKSGDKIGVHEIIFDLIPYSAQAFPTPRRNPSPQMPPGTYENYGNLAYQAQNQAQHYHGPQPHLSAVGQTSQELVKEKGLAAFIKLAQDYIENVLLPGIYKLPEIMEFKNVLILFMGVFIVTVTSLSTIPLIRILKESIEEEAQQHALTIASTLAKLNRPALMQGMDSAVSVESALNRPGVKKAFIISNVDGNVIAPASQAGSYPDISFIHEARKKGKEAVEQIDSDTVVAIVPIDFYNSDTGSHAVTAHAIVIYDMGSLAVDDNKTLSLFIQTMFIALLVGGILFFFLFKMIEYPITSINSQLDTALKDGQDNIHIKYQFPALQKLVSNIGSALSRMGQDGGSTIQTIERDRRLEMSNMIELIGYGAIAIEAANRTLVSISPAFENQTGIKAADVLNNSVDSITDQALRLSLIDLIARLEQNPDQLATNELEFSGQNFQLAAQAIYGSSKVAYYLVALLPVDMGGGAE